MSSRIIGKRLRSNQSPSEALKRPNGLAAGKMEGPRPDKFAFVKRSGTIKSPVGTLSNGTVLRQQDGGTKSRQVPIWQKSNLTLEEAAAYSGIGINKLRSMTDSDECKFVLWNGTKRLIKRRKLDEYLDKAFSI